MPPVDFIPTTVSVKDARPDFYKRWFALFDWIYKVAYRINYLWTGDWGYVEFAGAETTVTFKRKYKSEPLVQLTIVKETPPSNVAVMVKSFTVVSNEYVGMTIAVAPSGGTKRVCVMVVGT